MKDGHPPASDSELTWERVLAALIPAWALVAVIVFLHVLFPGTPHPNAAAVAQADWFQQTTCNAPLPASGPARTVRISPARARAEACSNAPADAPVFIALMPIGQARRRDGGLQKSKHQSWEWLVTVHADRMTEGGLLGPRLKHVYSLSMNATTGWYDDYCVGCALLG